MNFSSYDEEIEENLINKIQTLHNNFTKVDVQNVYIYFLYVVNQAKWLIVSNSTFGWWAAWLNSTANKILAPKYFGAHNTSDGYWCVGENYTRSFHYVDRDGNISDYETCKNEAIEFYKSKNIIKDENI